MSLRALTHEGGEVSGAIACLVDVSDSIAMREELRRRATHDELTGCLNRAAITRSLEQDIAELLEICDRADASLGTAEGYPVSLSAEFHTRMARATHNPAIGMLVQSFHEAMLTSLRRAQEEDPQVGVKGTAEHREFVMAVQDRDPVTAEAIMRRHLARTAERLRPHS